MAKTIVGLYEDMTAAQSVVRELTSHGFQRDDVSLVANDQSGEMGRGLGTTTTTANTEDASSGAATGAGVGALLGGLGGLLVGLGALAIPGVGPIIAAGPIAAALAGAGIGAVAGGLIGALVDAGVPEEEATLYNEGVRRGGTLVMVNAPDNMANQAAEIMERFNPIDVDQRSADWERTGWERHSTGSASSLAAGMTGSGTQKTGSTSGSAAGMTGSSTQKTGSETRHDVESGTLNQQGERTIPIVEEDLRVGKREVQSGGVRVHARVEEHPVEEDVTLRQERVEVTRRPTDRPATDADINAFREGTFEVTETSEEAVVSKQARVTEEVVIDKDVEHKTETVRDTVRKTAVETEDLTANRGATGTTSTTGTTGMKAFETYDPDFRRHYQTSFSSSGRDFTQYQPAYRYGYDLANNKSYTNREWRQVEQDARRDWSTNHPDSAWEDFKDAVREGWDRVRGRR